MKTVKLAIKVDVEELPCCEADIRTLLMNGVLTDENVVYVFRNGKLYKREISDFDYDDFSVLYSTPYYIDYDHDIMEEFEEIPLSLDSNLVNVLQALMA